MSSTLYRDNLTRFFVDVLICRNTVSFQGFQGTTEKRFNQLDVWITSYPLDVI